MLGQVSYRLILWIAHHQIHFCCNDCEVQCALYYFVWPSCLFLAVPLIRQEKRHKHVALLWVAPTIFYSYLFMGCCACACWLETLVLTQICNNLSFSITCTCLCVCSRLIFTHQRLDRIDSKCLLAYPLDPQHLNHRDCSLTLVCFSQPLLLHSQTEISESGAKKF